MQIEKQLATLDLSIFANRNRPVFFCFLQTSEQRAEPQPNTVDLPKLLPSAPNPDVQTDLS